MTHVSDRGRRNVARWVVATLTLIGLLLPATGALAGPPPARLDQINVAPGIVRQVYRYAGDGGGVDVQVLRFRPDDTRVTFQAELGDSDIPGLEPTQTAVRRFASQGAIAGVNASFFSYSGDPVGDPIGLFVSGGSYASHPERGSVWRGGFGVEPDGRTVFDYPAFKGRITFPNNNYQHRITAMNRQPKGPSLAYPTRREIVFFTPDYGPSTGTPTGLVEVVFENVVLTTQFEAELVVREVTRAGNSKIPHNGVVMAATGTVKDQVLEQLTPGSKLHVQLNISGGWERAVNAVQGGPMLLRGGARTSAASWEREGFSPSSHSNRRHPRTAVGRTADGEMLLLTADGRTSRSAGLTVRDTQTLMLHLGAVDAVMMDGGGSTTMVVDNAIVNDPCCDSAGYRSVASNLLLSSTMLREPDVDRIGEGDHYDIAADIARDGWPVGSDTVLLASSYKFPDALAGGPLAAKRDLPILLTRPDSVPYATMQALRDLGTTDVIILGGPTAVHDSVANQLERAGIRPRRVFGDTRIHTAARIARILKAPNGQAIVASSEFWADSASATVPASLADAPLLLTQPEKLHPLVARSLAGMNVREVIVAGGPRAISENVVQELHDLGFQVTRLAGSNRYGTSAELANWAQRNGDVQGDRVILARGDQFQTALVAGPLGAKRQTPVLLVDRFGLERSLSANEWLSERVLQQITLLGDRTTMSSWLGYQAQHHLDRRSGYSTSSTSTMSIPMGVR